MGKPANREAMSSLGRVSPSLRPSHRFIGAIAVLCLSVAGVASAARAQSPVQAEAEPTPPAEIAEGSGAVDDTESMSAQELRAFVDARLTQWDGGDPSGAQTEMLTFLSEHPRLAPAASLFSVGLRERSAFDEAIAFLRLVIEANPANDWARFELGSLLMALLEFEDAAEVLGPVQPGSAQYGFARNNLATALQNVGDLSGAREVLRSLSEGRQAVFAAAALCEVDLAESGPDSASECLETQRARFGDHAVFAIRDVFVRYLQGEGDAALEAANALISPGSVPTRMSALRVLVPLASGDADAAASALPSVQITVRGERSALQALIDATRGDRVAAATAYGEAVARNPLFADPALAGQVLLWDPSLAERLASVAGEVGETTLPTAAETPGNQADVAAHREAEPPSSGCCATVGSGDPTGEAVRWQALAIVVGVFWITRRRRLTAVRAGQREPGKSGYD